MLSKSGLISILVFCGISQLAAIGIGVMLVRKNDAMARDLQKLQVVWEIHTKKPVFCETLQTVLPPPPPTPVLPPHIPYKLLTTDRTMYAIYQNRCRTKKGFEGFQADMVALNSHPESPRKISDARALGKIKADQDWWFPPYCTGLTTNTSLPLAKK